MCLAIPVEIQELLPDNMAKVTIGGVGKVISVALVENPEVGDFVVMHVGYALTRIDPEEARKTLEVLAEMGTLS